MPKNKKFSLSSRNLKHKLNVAFSLMSILPLLVCIYLVANYILPQIGIKLHIALSVIISVIIAVFGFLVLKEIFDRIVDVSRDAKLIASGNINHRIDIHQRDELGDLGDALNLLTRRIRTDMEELKAYGEKTSEINFEIQKRILALSNLLQVSSFISQSTKLDDILRLATEKARALANSDAAYLLLREEGEEVFSVKAADGLISAHLLQLKLEPKESIFEKMANADKYFLLDKENVLPQDLTTYFYEKFKLKNMLAVPVYAKGRVAAILGIGNTKTAFRYKKDDVELLDIFAKQIAIAVENDLLARRVEKLEIRDALTGLYNEVFIRNRLEEEIRRAIAYQRPCAFVVLDVDNFKDFHEVFGLLQAESTLKKISSLVKTSITEIDRAARLGDNEFAIVLPEKNKRQAGRIAEEIRKKIEFTFGEEPDPQKRLTLSAGVAENPLDGIEAEELISKARELLALAKMQGRNRVVLMNT